MNESDVEAKMKKFIKQRGGMSTKMHSRSWPDLYVLTKDGYGFFIEIKMNMKGGWKLTPHQMECHKRIRERGKDVYVIDVSDGDWERILESLL